ncbi:hypothetical protein RND81_08G055900 [Saponaria officinalis]|uniref:tRNA(Ile)-lysidine synthetase n=1 Tax=Saponaria officinalis TaxID=3572 RepID=A0AAW1J3W4_SAPOF
MLTTSHLIFSPTILRNGVVSFLLHRSNPTRFYCRCSDRYRVPPEYSDVFARRMSSAALRPHHRIGFINGLLAIIVDHGLRSESKEESETVSHWVSEMGIRCEVVSCDWPIGLPKVGHLEEAARDMRYQIFQDVCSNNQFGVLLTAHHADDQAELFVLRLSRNSGALGLAGMASTSQIFPKISKFTVESSNNTGILLIRPLLDFTKKDLYKICECNNQKWVEDPSNRSSLFARNRIRMALRDINTCAFRSELQALIATCRRTRLYVDHICQVLLKEKVTIMPHGYAVIDLESLNPSNQEEICLSRFLALVVQFISQRHRPVRGSASKLLLEYIRSSPCKTSVTAAGCYLSPAPGSKGTKVLVSCSVETSRLDNTELYSTCRGQVLNKYCPSDADHIIMDQKSEITYLVPDPSDVHFLKTASSYSILDEARILGIISESTCGSITKLQIEEQRIFKSKNEFSSGKESKNDANYAPAVRKPFRPGESCYFMNRFLLTWIYDHKSAEDGDRLCSMCMAGDMSAYVRHIIDEDWLYLANLSKSHDSDKLKQQTALHNNGVEKLTVEINLRTNHARRSAEQALKILKPIPAAARRGLPVIVSADGILLSIPSIGFNHCPSLMISVEFRPRIPLGGGHSSFA